MPESVNTFPFSNFRLALGLLLTRHGCGMLRIQRKANGEVVFILSGRLDMEHISEMEALIGAEEKDRRIILDLKDMTLTGEDGVAFLAKSEAGGIALVNCDPYVREWITRQRNAS